MGEIIFGGKPDIYRISDERFLRQGKRGRVCSSEELSADEYFSYSLLIMNKGKSNFIWKRAEAVIDGKIRWKCVGGSALAGQGVRLHVYNSVMKRLSTGSHYVSWYLDGKEVFSDSFMLTYDFDWSELTRLPSQGEIAAYTNPEKLRSPYIAVWLDIPYGVRYKEYTVDFKADYLPKGTYCCLGSWYMDYSELEKSYKKAGPEGVSAYAGFQNIHNADKLAIMSFWDVYCTDKNGKVTTVKARVEYPEDNRDGRFGGEGTGAQCLEPYEWEKNHWYRMRIRCFDGESGTTLVEMWACDLETGKNTLICRYDTLIKNSAFKGNIAIFLENYLTEYAGEIRTLELCNARYLEEKTGRWREIKSGTVMPNSGAVIMNYSGSYDCGVRDGRLWIMTTGVGDRHKVQQTFHFKPLRPPLRAQEQ